jgi:hypothetical protein
MIKSFTSICLVSFVASQLCYQKDRKFTQLEEINSSISLLKNNGFHIGFQIFDRITGEAKNDATFIQATLTITEQDRDSDEITYRKFATH